MKKLLLILIAASSIVTSKAQSKGDVLLYGGINFNSQNDPYGEKNSYLNFSPGVGYFINENWAAGLFCNLTRSSSLDTAATAVKNIQSLLSVGPFVRYSHKLSDIFFIFGQLDLGYATSRANAGSIVLPNAKGTGWYAMFTPTVGINVHKGFALNFGIGGVGYKSTKSPTAPKADGRASITFGNAIQFGISKFFNTGRKATPQTP
jgi:hypothetical protein